MKSISLRTLVSAIGMLVAITTAVSMPVGYFVVGYTNTAGLFDFKADLNARFLAKYIYTHDTLWQYQRVRLAELLEQTNGGKDSRKRVVDAAGKLVLDEGAELAPPVLTRSAPIEVAGTTVGRVEISTSLRPLVHRNRFRRDSEHHARPWHVLSRCECFPSRCSIRHLALWKGQITGSMRR